MRLHNYIKQLRNFRKISQYELSNKIGVSRSTVYHWEGGKHIPREFMIKCLHSYLGGDKSTWAALYGKECEYRLFE